MNPEQQRIKIAEACGWERREPDNLYPEVRWLDPKDTSQWRSDYARRDIDLPDYLNDLNSLHEAEKVLGPKQKPVYCSELWELCVTPNSNHEWKMLHATAAQRAEAFLKCLGLWKEEPVSEATVEGLR